MKQFLTELPTEIRTEINESLTNLEVKLNTPILMLSQQEQKTRLKH